MIDGPHQGASYRTLIDSSSTRSVFIFTRDLQSSRDPFSVLYSASGAGHVPFPHQYSKPNRTSPVLAFGLAANQVHIGSHSHKIGAPRRQRSHPWPLSTRSYFSFFDKCYLRFIPVTQPLSYPTYGGLLHIFSCSFMPRPCRFASCPKTRMPAARIIAKH